MNHEVRVIDRPDGRRFLFVPGPDNVAERLDRVLASVPGEVFIEVDESSADRLALLGERGFEIQRREGLYSVPVRPNPATMPAGYTAISAADADLDLLRRLDESLRHDVPGSRGWRNDPATFERYVTGDPEFDPATYLVAVGPDGAYAGLVRVWIAPGLARLGLIGVLPAHRRRGLAVALVAAVFGVLHARGVGAVTCEVDDTNVASNTLMKGLGASRVGGVIELVRRAQPVG